MGEDHQHNHAVDATHEVVDPVCGMTVTEDAPRSFEHGDQKYYFCSDSCFRKFQADPDRYLQSKPATPSLVRRGEVEYTCPMHSDIRQMRPGVCPKCGMSLEPATFVSPQSGTKYTCPMHPEIVRDEPG